MQVVIGNSQATQQLSAYDDEVSMDMRDTDESLECGPLDYKLIDENNSSPSFAKVNQQNSQLRLVVNSTVEEEIGEHLLSLTVSLKKYPQVQPLLSSFKVKILPGAQKEKYTN